MQLMMPTPMKALRQARSASPSSERRAPEAAAIYPDLFAAVGPPVLPIFPAIVHLRHINVNAGDGLIPAPIGGPAAAGQHRWRVDRTDETAPPGERGAGRRVTAGRNRIAPRPLS